MTVLVYLVPLALFLGLVGLFGFLWSLRNHQYDDLDGAALRILDDNDVDGRSAPGKRRFGTDLLSVAQDEPRAARQLKELQKEKERLRKAT